ncbi:MAG: trypsin-like peptidase domain-containing protein [Deltaproteobacteria bacterium]|nr:trypsin-like peptidase domain-containing protein [Deltaproteobacteria bacterium]
MRILLLPLLLLLACAPAPAPVVPTAPDAVEMLASAQPGVVLLVAELDGGGQRFGAGLLVRQPGLVLTNAHVVRGATRLRALLFDPARRSWSPIDGGIHRTLFEEADELLDVELVRGDMNLDLAVVRVLGDTSGLPILPLRDEPPRPGERVYALGHPQESAWSCTAGVVSAIHQGAIQHDAPVNQGSSGGPLLDAWGRVVGVNTAKLFGGAEGLAFARPIELATPMLNDALAPVVVDRSDPAKAVLSCERAVELSPSLSEPCFSWDSAEDLIWDAARRGVALAELPEGPRERLLAWMQEEGHGLWMAELQDSVWRHLAGVETPGERRRFEPPASVWVNEAERQAHLSRSGVEARLRAQIEAFIVEGEARRAQLIAATGVTADFTQDGQAYREARRMGQRVQRSVVLGSSPG